MIAIEFVFWLSIGGVVYGYAGYPLILSLCHLFCRRHASKADPAHQPAVSILMAAYNEEAYIRQKLENCLALEYPPEKVEILIGSDGSEDATNEIVREYEGNRVRLLEFQPRRGKMAAINRLVRAAQNEICLFSDVSERFDPDALAKLVRHFADPEVGLVAGNHIFDESTTGIGRGTALYRRFKRFCWRVESRIYSTVRCDGPIYACRRELFPFPPDGTINDDIAVPFGVLGQGKRLVFEPQAICRGESHASADVFFRQKIRVNAGRYQLLTRFNTLFWPWPLRRWWIFVSHHVIPLFVPWMMLMALITNALLWQSGELHFQVLLILQCLFYMLAAIGYFGERIGIHRTAVAVPFYFVASNVGSLFGFLAFLSGRQRATWRKLDPTVEGA